MSSHPGRLNGDWMIPACGSSGPPQAMPTAPIPLHGTPDASTASRPSSRWRAIIASGPSSTRLGATRFDRTVPSRATTPAASFVPPTSRASTWSSAASWLIRSPLVPPWSRAAGSAFRTGRRDALEEVSLSEEEDDDHRHGHDHAACREELPLLLPADRGVVDDRLQAQRQRELGDVVDEDQRLQQVRPRGLQLEHEDDDQRGARQWQRDRPPDSQRIRTVDAGRLEHVPRQGQEELPEQEDVERRREQVAGPQRDERVVEAERLPDQEVGDDRDHARQEHRREDEPEDQVPPGESEVREREGDERGAERDGRRRKHGDDR